MNIDSYYFIYLLFLKSCVHLLRMVALFFCLQYLRMVALLIFGTFGAHLRPDGHRISLRFIRAERVSRRALHLWYRRPAAPHQGIAGRMSAHAGRWVAAEWTPW